MGMSPHDRIHGPARGSPTEALVFARNVGSARIEDVADYVWTVYQVAPQVGIDPAIVVSQSALETDNWRDTWWTERLNPAGVGITGDPAQNAASRTWDTGADAALAQIVHLWLYTDGDPLPEALAPYRDLDPRADAIPVPNRGSVTTLADLGAKWAAVADYGQRIATRSRSIFPALPDQSGDTTMALTYGRVPHPGYVDLQHTTADKPEGRGWNDLGPRVPKGVALHRMWGTLRGTDVHFANPNVPSLTDYGIGSGNIDGASLDGVIHQYNDPRGRRSGWASGRVSQPYGDGKAFVDKYGVNAVNRDLVSIETSGWDHEPFTDFAWSELVWLVAYWADQCEVPYTSLPMNPNTGINFIIWHEEFTYGTGKKCPFTWMKQNTSRLYADVKTFLQPYQEGGVIEPEPEPEPGLEYPAYLSADVAARLFGSATFGGAVYEYNERGSVSPLWLARGTATGQYPRLTEVFIDGGHKYFVFGDGSVVVDPEGDAQPQYIGTVEAVTEVVKDAVDRAA